MHNFAYFAVKAYYLCTRIPLMSNALKKRGKKLFFSPIYFILHFCMFRILYNIFFLFFFF